MNSPPKRQQRRGRMSILGQQLIMTQEASSLTPHEGIADCCDAQGLPAVQLGGEVIVPVGELTVAFGTETEDEENLEVEFELYAGWVDDEEVLVVEFVL
jgi:hypothetical protein